MRPCSACLERVRGPSLELRVPNGYGVLRLAFCGPCWPDARGQFAAALQQEQYTARLHGAWAALVEGR